MLLIVPSRYFCSGSFCFMSWCLIFVLLAPYVCFHIFSKVKVTEWPPIGKIAAHSAYDMFCGIKYLIVALVFSHLGFWSGSLFLIASFPDLCLLVPFQLVSITINQHPTLRPHQHPMFILISRVHPPPCYNIRGLFT